MKGFKAIVIAVVLCLSAVAISVVAYGQTFMVDRSGNTAFPYGLDGQENALNDMPAALTYADMPASGQSIIFKDGVPTTLVNIDGSKAAYSESMWDFLGGYIENGANTVGISSNPNGPTGGTWVWTDVSGTMGTQEPNLNLN